MMYRGYFLEQLAHLRRISGDAKYDQPFDLVYDDDICYRYSAEQIAAGLCEQFRAPMDANGSSLRPGIDCEVGKVFPICVTVGGLAMLLYDQLHGTDYTSGYESGSTSPRVPSSPATPTRTATSAGTAPTTTVTSTTR